MQELFVISEATISLQGPGRPEDREMMLEKIHCAEFKRSPATRRITDDFDIDGGAGASKFVLQSHFVDSSIRVEAAVNLQVTGRVLLPVNTITDTFIDDL